MWQGRQRESEKAPEPGGSLEREGGQRAGPRRARAVSKSQLERATGDSGELLEAEEGKPQEQRE